MGVHVEGRLLGLHQGIGLGLGLGLGLMWYKGDILHADGIIVIVIAMATSDSGKWHESSFWLFQHMNPVWLLDLTALFEKMYKGIRRVDVSPNIEYVLQSDILGIFFKKNVSFVENSTTKSCVSHEILEMK